MDIYSIIGIITVIIIIITISLILFLMNKKAKDKIYLEKQHFQLYKRTLRDLKYLNQYPDQKFDALNKIARSFFKEYFHLEPKLTYLELSKKFKKMKKENYSIFCKLFSDLKYSGRPITQTEVNELISFFNETINKI